VRKNILKTPEKKLKKNISSNQINKYKSPPKLTEKEKATLLEVFTLSNKRNTEKHPKNINMVRTRSKSPFVKQNLEFNFLKYKKN